MRAVFEARFSISVFFFEKQHAVFFGKDLLAVLATEIGESSISGYLYWGAKTGPVFTSIVVISQLQSIIQDQAEVTSMGTSACVF